jgi:hypothetical protein
MPKRTVRRVYPDGKTVDMAYIPVYPDDPYSEKMVTVEDIRASLREIGIMPRTKTNVDFDAERERQKKMLEEREVRHERQVL